ncbi:ABC transporter substrate-binding protein [Amycolatopsis rhabdoformis]|uniref:ABC transporter substrate-binding protein n=1 Tax=Amycolatopsis rhabdoformis TaxID=1448059 RepID=A0ABZ1IEW5_9PSEU|nr:ABC transporter substrate-binding protein [Amycolatopsis rhabdoformis]WSE32089.1 ABC transporter substrate-binding protein [Amycolatopsis rhabdoformis]
MPTSSRTRRTTAVAAVLATLSALLTACGGGSSSAGDTKTIRVELFCSGLAPIAAELALNSGIAAQKGITIKPMCVTSGSTATNALIGGSADVFMGDIGHVVLAQKRGVKMKAYGVVNDRFSYLMVSRNDPALTSVKDLKGQKVAVTAPGTLSDTELQKAALDAGLDPKKDLTVVSGGAGATMQAELTGNQVVAGMTSQPDTLQLLRTGKFKILWQQPDYRYVDIVAMADQDWVGEHQDLMKTFLSAMSEASQQAKANPDQATTWMKKQGYKISDADLKTIVTEAVKSVPDSFRPDDAVVNSSTDLLVRTGFLTKPVPAIQDTFDYSLLPAK